MYFKSKIMNRLYFTSSAMQCTCTRVCSCVKQVAQHTTTHIQTTCTVYCNVKNTKK